MHRTIAQLWNGDLEPIRYFGVTNAEMKKAEIFMQCNLEKLKENSSETMNELFQRYEDSINEYILISNEQAFCDGFCLGAKITAEAFSGAEEIL
ncbi:MAG: hypothetical protein IJB19_06965 [Clostridia bacterium]|nr:hypothetical protein [Clostridia bacterium]